MRLNILVVGVCEFSTLLPGLNHFRTKLLLSAEFTFALLEMGARASAEPILAQQVRQLIRDGPFQLFPAVTAAITVFQIYVRTDIK